MRARGAASRRHERTSVADEQLCETTISHMIGLEKPSRNTSMCYILYINTKGSSLRHGEDNRSSKARSCENAGQSALLARLSTGSVMYHISGSPISANLAPRKQAFGGSGVACRHFNAQGLLIMQIMAFGVPASPCDVIGSLDSNKKL